VRLFPDFAASLAPDAALAWETRGVAPLVVAGEKLTEIRREVMDGAPGRRSASARLASQAG
jgi:hypothetical protein